MNNALRCHALAAVSLACTFSDPAFAVDAANLKNDQFDLEKTKIVVSSLIEKTLKDTGVPSISIALVRGDSIVWKAAFGYANVRAKTPATPQFGGSDGSYTARLVDHCGEETSLIVA